MAASKAVADAAHGIEHSSLVTATTISCNDFAIRVSGLGDSWFRGTPAGIDVGKVVESGILPVIDGGLAGRGGGQIGAGILKAPYECFAGAWAAYLDRNGPPGGIE